MKHIVLVTLSVLLAGWILGIVLLFLFLMYGPTERFDSSWL